MAAEEMPMWSGLGVDRHFSLLSFLNIRNMAKTEEGKKKVYVPAYTYRDKNGRLVKVPAHYRSTPN